MTKDPIEDILEELVRKLGEVPDDEDISQALTLIRQQMLEWVDSCEKRDFQYDEYYISVKEIRAKIKGE